MGAVREAEQRRISEVYNVCVGMKYEMRSDYLRSLRRDWCDVFYTCMRQGGNGAPLLLWLYTVSYPAVSAGLISIRPSLETFPPRPILPLSTHSHPTYSANLFNVASDFIPSNSSRVTHTPTAIPPVLSLGMQINPLGAAAKAGCRAHSGRPRMGP